MKISQSGRHDQALSEINVTPLVDVMLVLLIIFMVTAPLMQRGIDLDLPQAGSATNIDEDRVVISLNHEGTIYIDQLPVTSEQLPARLKALAARRPGEGVYLRADRDLPYGRVLAVMDQLRVAGILNIGGIL